MGKQAAASLIALATLFSAPAMAQRVQENPRPHKLNHIFKKASEATVNTLDKAAKETAKTLSGARAPENPFTLVVTLASKHVGEQNFLKPRTSGTHYVSPSALQNLPGFSDLADLMPRTLANMKRPTTQKEEEAFSEFNPGLALEYRLTSTFHISAGFYRNSYRKHSNYALIGAETRDHSDPVLRYMGLGIEVGAITGYKDKPVPAALPYVRLGTRNGMVNGKIGYIPQIKGVTPTVFTFQGRINIQRLNRKH